eukprot:g48938.t1
MSTATQSTPHNGERTRAGWPVSSPNDSPSSPTKVSRPPTTPSSPGSARLEELRRRKEEIQNRLRDINAEKQRATADRHRLTSPNKGGLLMPPVKLNGHATPPISPESAELTKRKAQIQARLDAIRKAKVKARAKTQALKEQLRRDQAKPSPVSGSPSNTLPADPSSSSRSAPSSALSVMSVDSTPQLSKTPESSQSSPRSPKSPSSSSSPPSLLASKIPLTSLSDTSDSPSDSCSAISAPALSSSSSDSISEHSGAPLGKSSNPSSSSDSLSLDSSQNHNDKRPVQPNAVSEVEREENNLAAEEDPPPSDEGMAEKETMDKPLDTTTSIEASTPIAPTDPDMTLAVEMEAPPPPASPPSESVEDTEELADMQKLSEGRDALMSSGSFARPVRSSSPTGQSDLEERPVHVPVHVPCVFDRSEMPYWQHWTDIPDSVDRTAFRLARPEDFQSGRTIYVRWRKATCKNFSHPHVYWTFEGDDRELHRSVSSNPEMFTVMLDDHKATAGKGDEQKLTNGKVMHQKSRQGSKEIHLESGTTVLAQDRNITQDIDT